MLNKQKDIDKNNYMKNSINVYYDYQVGDKEVTSDKDIYRKLNFPTKLPYSTIQVYTNVTICVQQEVVTERINIRDFTPYTS